MYSKFRGINRLYLKKIDHTLFQFPFLDLKLKLVFHFYPRITILMTSP